MKKMKAYSFIDPLYDASITYLIGGTVMDLIDYIKLNHGTTTAYSWNEKFEIEAEDAHTTDGYQFHINAPSGTLGETFYCWMRKPTAALLFHETFHLVGDILHNRGIKYSSDSEEAFAYLGGWISNKIYSSLRNKLSSTKT